MDIFEGSYQKIATILVPGIIKVDAHLAGHFEGFTEKKVHEV